MLVALCVRGVATVRNVCPKASTAQLLPHLYSPHLTSLRHACILSLSDKTRTFGYPQHIDMQSLAAMDTAADLVRTVHQLKIDRDTWQALAQQYKAAFETQTARLREMQDICFATQAELENERAQYRRLHMGQDGAQNDHAQCRRLRMDLNGAHDDRPLTPDSTDVIGSTKSFGCAIALSPSRIDMSWKLRPSEADGNLIFKRVQQFKSQGNFGTALVEIQRLLRGPLSPKARAEGLLLKSSLLQAIGPDSLYDALAACSEALELCDRVPELQSLLPKLQYQRGLYSYQLQMPQQAKEAFKAASEDNLLLERTKKYHQSCEDELELLHHHRRSAFDEARSMSNSVLTQVNVGSSHVSWHRGGEPATAEELQSRLRRTSAQLKLRAALRAKHMSFPHRWVSSKSDILSKTDEV